MTEIKNQYRCETCNFKGKGMMGDERCPYDVQKTNEDNCDLLYSFRRSEEIQQFINLCGCASHSSQQNERDKVLDEAIEAIDDCWKNMNHGSTSHQHKIKRQLFLRFRNRVEFLRSRKPGCK